MGLLGAAKFAGSQNLFAPEPTHLPLLLGRWNIGNSFAGGESLGVGFAGVSAVIFGAVFERRVYLLGAVAAAAAAASLEALFALVGL